MKKCSRCGESKSIKDFHRDKNSKDGLVSSCRFCYYKWRKDNKDRILSRRRELVHIDPRRKLIADAKYRAKVKGLEFDLTINDIVVPSSCPILGIPLYVNSGVVCDNSPSLDRTNQELGYIKGNVAVISFRANTIKNSASVDELRRIVDWLVEVGV